MCKEAGEYAGAANDLRKVIEEEIEKLTYEAEEYGRQITELRGKSMMCSNVVSRLKFKLNLLDEGS